METLEIQGLAELEERLKDLADNKLAEKMLYSALSAAATPMVKEAKQRAIVAEKSHLMRYGNAYKASGMLGTKAKFNRYVEVKPGLLKESIRRRKLKKGEMAKLGIEGVALSIYVGKGTKQKLYPRYWHFIEYGTSKMSATPFLRPAFEMIKEQSLQRFKEKLTQNLDKSGA